MPCQSSLARGLGVKPDFGYFFNQFTGTSGEF
jgi:hypothetical protein